MIATYSRLLFALLLLPLAAMAQKIPMTVDHSGEDPVGKVFAFELREAIQGSHSARLINAESLEPRVRVSIVSMDTSVGTVGLSSAMGISVSYDSMDVPLQGALITTYAYHCGKNVAAQCAREVLAMLVEAAESLQKRKGDFYKKLKGR